MRFVAARYGRGHDYGIMIGYVVVPPVSGAVPRVGEAMDKRKEKTREQTCFTRNDILCSHPNTHISSHMQEGTNSCINLVHVFLDFCLAQGNSLSEN